MKNKRSLFKRSCVLLGLLSALLLCSGCGSVLPDALRIVTLSGAPMPREIPLQAEESKELSLDIDLRFSNPDRNPITILPLSETQSTPRVSVVYPADLDDYGFFCRMEDGVLCIGAEQNCQFRTEDFRMTIYADVTEIRLDGSLMLEASFDASLPHTETSLAVRGAAECHIKDLYTETMTVTGDGAVDIIVSGQTRTLTAEINGAGAMDLALFPCEEASVSINGAGTADVFAAGTLDVTIRGAGRVVYYGSPKITRDIAGAGSIAAAPAETAAVQAEADAP